MICAHDFKSTWRCFHMKLYDNLSFAHQDECASGHYTYTCKLCKESGYALLDGVKPTTTIYGEYSATRQQEVRDQVEGVP